MVLYPGSLTILVASLHLYQVACTFLEETPYATYINFAATDILDGDDGLTPHPMQPLPYGKPTYPTTMDGNGREQIEAHLSYFEGKYWMHSATWGCGGSLFSYGRISSMNYPRIPTYPSGDYGADGNCGIKSFSSEDFTNWQLEDFYQPSTTVANVTKPVVRYSKASGEYVMFMGGNAINSNFFYATSKSPGGPWSNPPSLMQGNHISHDFDIAVGPDGTHYMVADVIANTTTSDNVPGWDIWVHQLAPDLKSTASNKTSVLVRTAQALWKDQQLTLEAVGFFYHDGFWYLTWGETVQNGAGYVYYHYARNPLGPWTDGGFLSIDGCGAQNKGVNVLPSSQGPVILAGMLGYRTSPTNYVTQGSPINNGAHVWHADNHQAASSTYFFPIEFNEDHTLKNWTCPRSIKVPLADTAKAQPEEPIPYQLDCRIRNWQDVRVIIDPPRKGSMLEIPVWQRTDNLASTMNAGPILDGFLNIQVELLEGRGTVIREFFWPASNISWAPTMVSMNVTGSSIMGITLSTNATNGCFGTMVQPKIEAKNLYSVVVKGAQGYEKVSPKAELYIPYL
jgi:hypothetical protein